MKTAKPMTTTEIKKELYKQKPNAVVRGTKNHKFWYRTTIKYLKGYVAVNFLIPPEEAKTLKDIEPAQLLIRWLEINDKNQEK